MEEIILEGSRRLDKNRIMLIPPLIKFLAYGLLLLAFGAAVFVGIIAKISGVAAVMTYLVFALAFIVCVLIVSAMFSAAMIGAAKEALSGQKPSSDTFFAWGKRRWARVFLVNAAVLALYLALFLLFTPTLILAIWGKTISAIFLGLLTGSIVIGSVFLASILLMPVTYIAVLEDDLSVLRTITRSKDFVKKNLVESLIVQSAVVAVSSFLGAASSIFTGPPMLIPYVGIFIALPIIIILSVAAGTAVEAQSTMWWVNLYQKKK